MRIPIQSAFALFVLFSLTSLAVAEPNSVVTQSISDITTTGIHSNQITVEYSDPDGMNTSTYDQSDITVTGPGGALFVTSASASGNEVTYTFSISGGAWAQADNGAYTINLVAGQVSDLSGSTVSAKQLQTFNVDIDTTRPTAVLTANIPDVSSTGATPNTLQVSYADADSGLDLTTIDTSDLSIIGPGGALTIMAVVVADDVATYTVAPPGGAWAQADNGDYSITLNANQILDNRGNSVNSRELQTFSVNIDTTRPTASLSSGQSDIEVATNQVASVQVTYTDSLSGMDVNSFDVNDITINDVEVTDIEIDNQTVTYFFIPDDGNWGLTDSGTKTIEIAEDEVFDQKGNAVRTQSIDSFNVAIDQETWGSETINIDRDIYINDGQTLLVTNGSTLQISDTDASNSGYFFDQVEFVIFGTVNFIGEGNQITPLGEWRGLTVTSEGVLNLGSVNLNGDVIAGGRSTLSFDGATIVGSLDLQSDATLTLQLQNSSTFDQVTVNGAVSLNGLFDLESIGYSISQEGGEMVVIQNDGEDAIDGQFSNLVEGALITQDGLTFRLSYQGGDGNDLSLALDCGEGNYASIQGCMTCPTGNQCPDNTNREVCLSGSYADEPGLQQCKLADYGYSVLNNAATSQEPCLKGYYQDQQGQSTCQQAPAGSYTDSDAATGFKTCLSGSYQPQKGQQECLPAPNGSYVDVPSATDFKTCPQGTYSNSGAKTESECFDVPILSVDKNRVEMGGHNYSQSSLEVITLTNAGRADLEVDIELVELADSSMFSLMLSRTVSSCTTSQPVLAQGESCTIDINYLAEQAGYHEQQIQLTSNALNATESVLVTASTEIPLIQASTTEISFSQGGDHTLTLTNAGVTPLVIDSLGDIETLSEPFYVVGDTCSNTSLLAQDNCTVTIRFTTDVLSALSPLGLIIGMWMALKANIRRRYKLLLSGVMMGTLIACGSDSEEGAGEYLDTFNISSNDPVTPSLLISVSAPKETMDDQ